MLETTVQPHMRRRAYTLVGGALGLGAPLGYLALRCLLQRRAPTLRFMREEMRAHPDTWAYLLAATTTVFSAFGRTLGQIEDERRRGTVAERSLRDEFTTLVTHDLRDPLQVILLETQMLLGQADDDMTRAPVASLRKIESTARRLSQVADDFQDAMQIELGRVALQPRPLRLPEAAAALIERLRPSLEPHPIALRVDGRPRPVLADPARIDQILRNLLENAAHFSWERAPITVTVRDHGGPFVSIAVEDQGVGIAARDLASLFDRVAQARRARSRKSGLGVGLYITRGLVEAHGGRVEVRSEPGKGSVFQALFPPASSVLQPDISNGTSAPSVATVRTYMDPHPPTAERTVTLGEARTRLGATGGPLLVIVDEGAPVGVIAERDLHAAEPDVAVADRMTPWPFVVSPDAPIEEVSRLMASQHYEAAIVAENGRVVGILGVEGALRALAGLSQTS